jgi:DME family drug/metabolite transporter
MVLMAAMLWGTTGTAQTLAPAGLPAHWVGCLAVAVCGRVLSGVSWLTASHRCGAQFAQVPWRWVLVAGGTPWPPTT